ncbi:MAG: AAA family ATPase [Patescibacteria group bacterium]
MKPLTPASPHAIIMVGIPGSGKSTFAEHFADTFQAPIINESRIAFEAHLDATQTESVSALLLKEVFKTQRTFIYEAKNLTRVKRVHLMNAVIKAGYKPLIVWVQTENNEAKRRALKPLPAGSGLTEDEFDATYRKFQPPTNKEKVVVISGKHTYASQLKIVLKQLAGTRPEAVVSHSTPRKPGNIVIR